MAEDKKQLRTLIRQRKRQFTESKLQELSFAITNKLVAHPRIANARVIMAYCSLPDEVDTHLLLDSLSRMGKKIVLPAVIGDSEMEARSYNAPTDLAIGAYGIYEPVGKRFENLEDIDVVIVPGMAFDAEGHRLGRGKGYYDRFLNQIPNSYKIGICFSFQMVQMVPTSSFDISMNEVISDK